MSKPTAIWFIRHGEVEAPHVGAFVGRIDISLSDLGHAQARGVAHFLREAEVDAIIASPRQRARLTADPLAEATGLNVEVRDPFAEMHFGDWEGKHWPEIEELDPDFAHKWRHDPATIPCPGGETANDFAARVQQGLHDTLEEFEGRQIALFAHAGTNRAVLSHVTQRPYMESFCFAQDYGCVNAAAWDPETGFGQVALVNHVPGPRSDEHGDGGRKVE